MNLAAWVMTMATPIVARVMVALGFAYVTHQAVQGLMVSVLQEVASSFGGLPAEATAILARAGFFLALSIWSGGILGGLAYGATRKLMVMGEQQTSGG